MTITNITSSNIQTVEYNEDINTLVVEFKSGAKYAYSNVPKEVFDRMITASSIGSYLNENIRNRYTYIRLS
jgi:hypothetical protein